MTESMPELSSQPGLILKTAREEMSLTIEQVAQELHLRPSVVKALEEENYSEFNSDVFLKGYFRTYCRLVKLHEERMIELLDKKLCFLKEKTGQAQELETKALLSRKRRKRYVTISVFLICSALIYLVYYMTSGSTNFFAQTNEASDASVEVSSPEQSASNMQQDDQTSIEGNNTDDFPAIEDDYETEVSRLKEEQIGKEQITDEQLVEEQVVEEQVVEEQVIEQQSAEDLADAAEPIGTEEFTNVTEEAADEPAVEPGVPGNVSIQFSGDCWLKLTDGTGKTVIADLKRENDLVNFQGITPFHIVLGDASKASLTFEGEMIDLARYSSRNGRAELTLQAKAAVSQGE